MKHSVTQAFSNLIESRTRILAYTPTTEAERKVKSLLAGYDLTKVFIRAADYLLVLMDLEPYGIVFVYTGDDVSAAVKLIDEIWDQHKGQKIVLLMDGEGFRRFIDMRLPQKSRIIRLDVKDTPRLIEGAFEGMAYSGRKLGVADLFPPEVLEWLCRKR